MMRLLVWMEHDGTAPKPGSMAALGFAQSVAEQSGGRVSSLVVGHALGPVVESLVSYGTVYVADDSRFEHPIADRYAPMIVAAAAQAEADVLAAAATTYSKDILGRAAGSLGGAMVGDVVAHSWHDGRLVFERPTFAGMITEKVTLHGRPQVVTVRSTAYPRAIGSETPGTAIRVAGPEPDATRSVWEHLETKTGARPDATDAQVVISGGRAFRDRDAFERLVGGLADRLDGAVACTRALVDAGITPNSMQVGQTGKIIAPELYIALGISGTVQHLAGMKNSKVVVAVNRDPEAPIFDYADYGLVGDVYDVVPELIEKLRDDGYADP